MSSEMNVEKVSSKQKASKSKSQVSERNCNDGSSSYVIKQGDCLWNVAKKVLVSEGYPNPRNRDIVTEMNREAKANGFENFEALSKKFWKPGPGFVIKFCGEEEVSSSYPKAKVTGQLIGIEGAVTKPVESKAPEAPVVKVETPVAQKVETTVAPKVQAKSEETSKNINDVATSETPFAVKSPTIAATAEGKTKETPKSDFEKQILADVKNGKSSLIAPEAAVKAPEAKAETSVASKPEETSKYINDVATSETPFAVKSPTIAATAEGTTKETTKSDFEKQILADVKNSKSSLPAQKAEVKAPESKVEAEPVTLSAGSDAKTSDKEVQSAHTLTDLMKSTTSVPAQGSAKPEVKMPEFDAYSLLTPKKVAEKEENIAAKSLAAKANAPKVEIPAAPKAEVKAPEAKVEAEPVILSAGADAKTSDKEAQSTHALTDLIKSTNSVPAQGSAKPEVKIPEFDAYSLLTPKKVAEKEENIAAKSLAAKANAPKVETPVATKAEVKAPEAKVEAEPVTLSAGPDAKTSDKEAQSAHSLTDLVKSANTLPTQGSAKPEAQLPSFNFFGLFNKKQKDSEVKPLLPRAKKSTLTEEAKAKLTAGLDNKAAAAGESSVLGNVLDSDASNVLKDVKTLKKANVDATKIDDTPKKAPELAKVIINAPEEVAKRSSEFYEVKAPVQKVVTAKAPETTTIKKETPVVHEKTAMELAEERYALADKKSAEELKARKLADAEAAKVHDAKVEADLQDTLKTIAQEDAEKAAKAKAQAAADAAKAKEPKLLTRPADAKFGNEILWSTDGKIYQQADGSTYCKLDEEQNLFYDMKKHGLSTFSGKKMSTVDESSVDLSKYIDLIDYCNSHYHMN